MFESDAFCKWFEFSINVTCWENEEKTWIMDQISADGISNQSTGIITTVDMIGNHLPITLKEMTTTVFSHYISARFIFPISNFSYLYFRIWASLSADHEGDAMTDGEKFDYQGSRLHSQ